MSQLTLLILMSFAAVAAQLIFNFLGRGASIASGLAQIAIAVASLGAWASLGFLSEVSWQMIAISLLLVSFGYAIYFIRQDIAPLFINAINLLIVMALYMSDPMFIILAIIGIKLFCNALFVKSKVTQSIFILAVESILLVLFLIVHELNVSYASLFILAVIIVELGVLNLRPAIKCQLRDASLLDMCTDKCYQSIAVIVPLMGLLNRFCFYELHNIILGVAIVTVLFQLFGVNRRLPSYDLFSRVVLLNYAFVLLASVSSEQYINLVIFHYILINIVTVVYAWARDVKWLRNSIIGFMTIIPLPAGVCTKIDIVVHSDYLINMWFMILFFFVASVLFYAAINRDDCEVSK